MGRPVVTTLTLAAAVSNGIAQAQSLAGAGNLTLNGSLVSGGVATLDSGGAARRVIVASVGNDSGITFTVTGTVRDPGNPTGSGIAGSEVLTGTNAGTAESMRDFLTVSKIAASGATAANVTAGTNGTGSGPWVPWDNFVPPFQVAVAAKVLSGAPTYQLDVTYDDVYSVVVPDAVAWADMTGKTAAAQTSLSESKGAVPVRSSRLTLTAVGGVQLTQNQQQGIV